MMKIREFKPQDEDAVISLWRDCDLVLPWSDPAADIARKREVDPELFLVGELGDGRLAATVMGGYEGHRGWINYLAVAPDCRRQGYGARMLQEAEARIHARGCPQVNLQVRQGNQPGMAFCRSLGYINDEVVSMGKRLEPGAAVDNLHDRPQGKPNLNFSV